MNEWDYFISALKNHWHFMIAGLFLGMIISIALILFQRPTYEARMTITPTQPTGMPSLGNILPQGLSETPVFQYFVNRIDAATSSDFTVFETLINSPRLASHLAEHNPELFNDKTSLEITQWLNKNVRVRPIGTTPFRRITLFHHDPEMALTILSTLFQETDMIIRKDTNLRTQRRITYLQQQLEKTRHPEHKNAILALLKEQEQTAMMVSIDHHFAAQPIDSPSLNPRIISPDPLVLFPVFCFGGFLFGFIISALFTAIRRS